MSSVQLVCRAQRQSFCHYHGDVHVPVEPETHDGLINIALSLTGKPNGYQFGTDTGLDLGALTPAGTLTDEAVVALSRDYGETIYGAESHIAKLGTDNSFNIAGIRKDLRDAQRQLDIDTWLQGETETTRRHQAINRALQLWTSDAAHRINQLAKTTPLEANAQPTLPQQDPNTRQKYTHRTQVRTDLGRAFKTWFPTRAA